MPKFPVLTAKQVIAVLKKLGFAEDRQKGSHLVLINLNTRARTIVPIHHGKTINRFLLKGIIDDAKVTDETFFSLFRK
ncbi:MAG: type II toxin-antitoxin system HicA family toxin [Candidatus Vogelbacteria bacterium]|nr:type II toxin-antitoxin system HicA family toxin [Candidatus Vogelbacteria bacterium]